VCFLTESVREEMWKEKKGAEGERAGRQAGCIVAAKEEEDEEGGRRKCARFASINCSKDRGTRPRKWREAISPLEGRKP